MALTSRDDRSRQARATSDSWIVPVQMIQTVPGTCTDRESRAPGGSVGGVYLGTNTEGRVLTAVCYVH